VACWFPARPAASVDPQVALRDEQGILLFPQFCSESEDDCMGFLLNWKLLAQCSALGMVRYTVKARRTIFYAIDEALQDMSNEVAPEHLLLGLLRADRSLCARVLMPTFDSIRDKHAANRGHQQSELVLSRAVKRAIFFAAQERERLCHRHTGTEHLVLGIIRTGSRAARALERQGITVGRVRKIIGEHNLHQRIVIFNQRIGETNQLTQNIAPAL
jgi:ATP-dependent Clp protease ATP-binding subunit ClpA